MASSLTDILTGIALVAFVVGFFLWKALRVNAERELDRLLLLLDAPLPEKLHEELDRLTDALVAYFNQNGKSLDPYAKDLAALRKQVAALAKHPSGEGGIPLISAMRVLQTRMSVELGAPPIPESTDTDDEDELDRMLNLLEDSLPDRIYDELDDFTDLLVDHDLDAVEPYMDDLAQLNARITAFTALPAGKQQAAEADLLMFMKEMHVLFIKRLGLPPEEDADDAATGPSDVAAS